MKKNKQNIVSFAGDVEDMEMLAILASEQDRTISWMIRNIIREYVKEKASNVIDYNIAKLVDLYNNGKSIGWIECELRDTIHTYEGNKLTPSEARAIAEFIPEVAEYGEDHIAYEDTNEMLNNIARGFSKNNWFDSAEEELEETIRYINETKGVISREEHERIIAQHKEEIGKKWGVTLE